VLVKAQDLARSFQDAANALSSTTLALNQKIDATVQQVNGLAAQIREYNVKLREATQPDAGLNTQMHTALESLSELTGITARFEDDGTVSVLLGGQSPLVLGDQAYSLSTSYADQGVQPNAGAAPAAHILDASGQDATGMISHGALGGLLQVRNTVLPSLQGDGQQAGALNILAKKVADRVNALLLSGTTSAGNPGVALFAYDNSSAVKTAATLKLDPGATSANLAPVAPGPPPVSNGIALALANLGSSTDPANQINGRSILDFYSATASEVGRQTSSANNGKDSAAQALAQARGFRSQISGVSLDEEAVRLTELQRGYQAASKLISVMDSLMQSLIDMVP
jgi:flagellar hook-associated protein 1 FlgK